MYARIAESGKPAFQLRPGEEGISVFDIEGVAPFLTEDEILGFFRPNSLIVYRSKEDIEGKGLQIVPIEGGFFLPARLRAAHAEIRPGQGMTRKAFKQILKKLE